jgi:hypothetical protein
MSLLENLSGANENNPAKLSLVDYNNFFDSPEVDDVPLELFDLGNLNLPTGNIIAADPLVMLDGAKPFNRTIAPGVYPVTACVARMEEEGNRYAFVKLQFSAKRASSWEMALIEGQKTSVLKHDDEFFGFGVDAGLGCFCDVQTQTRYNQWDADFMKQNAGGNAYDDFFANEFQKNAEHPDYVADWLNFTVPGTADLNIVMFSSGFGDGFYPCYWGVTDNGEICSLVVDFQVFYFGDE